ncbi:MAG: ATP-binding cassette domain-containing protein [Clostridia bacterium]|nr:ATP-binding cassette domain-containing protein [Clostridia bacterium]MBQ5808691.1 ATP-binding cassette domain-containing protein [Clostridia bacterium]MBR0327919.1 ATP-binding cassette domain-containing protein [Clostridia bacterium]
MHNENENEVLLKVDHLCQHFKFTKAVDDVSFEIRKGEAFGLVGESGCGKTTTGRSIIKLYNITSGDIYFKGIRIGAGIRSYQEAIKQANEDLKAGKITREVRDSIVAENNKKIAEAKYDQNNCDKEYSKKLVAECKAKYEPLIAAAAGEEKQALKKEFANELRKAKKTRLVTQIQMIFQDPIASLDPRMTVREIISEGLIIQGERDKKVIDKKVYEMLEMVGLVAEHAGRYPHEFSGGQRQRIGVARSIIMEPSLIIADEPVSALDVSIQAQVINLLNDLREKLGLTILFIAHDLSVVKYFSDRIGVMYFGKMVELAPSDELFRNPLHPYTRALLSAIPLPDPKYEKQRKRIVYNPLAEHDYSVDKPSFREITPGHFVHCNDAEFAKYQEIIK